MKKLILTITAIALYSGICVAQKAETSNQTQTLQTMNAKILVAYFSATGTTKTQAQTIASATGATLYEITPAEKYTDTDLDWRNKNSRSTIEMNTPSSRPALGGKTIDASTYDVVFVGFPNWWNQAPHIINSWIESQHLNGKIIIPFSTSGGSGIDNSVRQLRKSYPEIQWQDGCLLNCPAKEAAEWAKRVLSGKFSLKDI